MAKLVVGSEREKLQFTSVFWRPNLLVITQIKVFTVERWMIEAENWFFVTRGNNE